MPVYFTFILLQVVRKHEHGRAILLTFKDMDSTLTMPLGEKTVVNYKITA